MRRGERRIHLSRPRHDDLRVSLSEQVPIEHGEGAAEAEKRRLHRRVAQAAEEIPPRGDGGRGEGLGGRVRFRLVARNRWPRAKSANGASALRKGLRSESPQRAARSGCAARSARPISSVTNARRTGLANAS